MKNLYKIAIDGPAGSGKSTIAKILAQKLGFLYIDSGAMYRAVTLCLLKKKLINQTNNNFKKCIKKINIEFKNINDKQKVYLNNKDVTKQIRSSLVNKYVSEVSARKEVREEMVKRQKNFAVSDSVVMDGRDIGSNVFKDANLKIYLTASPLIRAKRRKKDLIKLSENVKLSDLIKQIQYRDDYDSSRAISPLLKPQDAVVIDSSYLNINEVLNMISAFLPVI